MYRPSDSGFARAALCAGVLLWGIAAGGAPASAAEAAGKVVMQQGAATAQAPGAAPRALASGAEVHAGERIATGPGAELRLVLADNTQVHLGADSEFRLVRFDARRESPSLVGEVAKGVFRIVTGLIAKQQPQAVRVTVPVSTIGIRGTHFGGEVTATSAVIVLLDPEESGARTGIEVYNDFGRVTIDEPGFGTEIPDAMSPPSAPRRMRLRAVDNLIRSLSNIQRLQVPRVPR